MREDWERVDAWLAERLLPADPALDAALAANAAGRAAGDRRLGAAGPAAAAPRPDDRRAGASSRSGRSAAIRRSGSPARCRPADGWSPWSASRTTPRSAKANLDRAGLADRVEMRVGRRARAAAGGRGSRALRLRLHRRRQGQQRRVPRLGAAARAPRHRHRLRQRDPRRPHRRRRQRRPRRQPAPAASSTASPPSRASPRPRSRPSAPRAGTASRWRSSSDPPAVGNPFHPVKAAEFYRFFSNTCYLCAPYGGPPATGRSGRR